VGVRRGTDTQTAHTHGRDHYTFRFVYTTHAKCNDRIKDLIHQFESANLVVPSPSETLKFPMGEFPWLGTPAVKAVRHQNKRVQLVSPFSGFSFARHISLDDES